MTGFEQYQEEHGECLRRIATLEAQLAEVTAERDAAIRNRCDEPIEHGAVAAIREVLKLTGDNHGFIDDDVARVVTERDTLRAALKQVAEALRDSHACATHSVATDSCCGCPVSDALALPVVQAILKSKC